MATPVKQNVRWYSPPFTLPVDLAKAQDCVRSKPQDSAQAKYQSTLAVQRYWYRVSEPRHMQTNRIGQEMRPAPGEAATAWGVTPRLGPAAPPRHATIAAYRAGATSQKLYRPLSVEKELPHSAMYRQHRYKGEEPEFSTMISKFVLHLSELSASPLDPDGIDKSTMRYLVLDNLGKTLLCSPFLKLLCEDCHPLYSMRRERAERLKRHLAKVCQYFGGVTQLVKMAKKWFPDGQILYRWVHDTFVGLGEETPLFKGFAGPRGLRRPTDAINGLDQHAIGCSKRSCFCCTLWIDTYNEQFGMGWITSDAATHGAGVDEAVVRQVQTRLVNALSWLYPESRRMYDDLDSSDDEILGSEQSFEEDDKIIIT
ncbi:hypothetical protein HETIRDRAFT_120490 [Heterobasidion irregulare TC 32-1]|uniref:Uncharacterized protein n=1 Tax=Heterobasidion irregulare (strain TC 32-1) TaxID=747525 RepID=W4JPF9_HETIT|nr:uncharacterized protein HETIRDRAFT_120490 [Heterobasidion irregulare TC 32-1]ETW74970.1 hypothetical protein HETIRDRAFT_120490 [Heterobasidion irregulare TC 32-1]